MKSVVALALTALSLALSSAGCANNDSDGLLKADPRAALRAPEREDERNFAVIMNKYSKFVVSPQPWAGYWWPYTDNGIASVHRDPAHLSPVDKYDQAYKVTLQEQGIDVSSGYNSAASWERFNHGAGRVNVAGWWGHCDGWAAASIMAPEPKAEKIINGIPFTVRDQKALLTELWLDFTSDFLGTRSFTSSDFEDPAFWDIVPAQFHLVLANVVAKQNRSLIFDRYTGDQVWNQPLVAYKFYPVGREDYLDAHPEYPDVYRVNVKARLWWADDNVDPDIVTAPFNIDDPGEPFRGRTLNYELWLDGPIVFDDAGNMIKSGNILLTSIDSRYIGGMWKNGIDPAVLASRTHPDYFWIPNALVLDPAEGDIRAERNLHRNPRVKAAWVHQNIGATHGT